MENDFVIEPVNYQDASGIADTLIRAMSMEEHYTIIFNRVPIQELIDDTLKRMCFNLCSERESKRHEKVIHVKSNKIVGYARWILPASVAGDSTWNEAQTPQPTEEDVEIYRKDYNSTLENGKRRIQNHEVTRGVLGEEKGNCFDELSKDQNSMELEFLTTAPEYQRKGIASLLLESGMKQAQKLNLNIIVMSTALGLPFYNQRGFHTVRTITQDYSRWGTATPRVTGFLIKEISTPYRDGKTERVAQPQKSDLV